MSMHILHRFGLRSTHCFATYLVEGQEEMLGMLLSIAGDTRNDYKIAFVLVNMQKQMVEHVIVYPGTGPGDMLVTKMLLHYDPIQTCWVITQLQDTEYLAMRTLFVAHDGKVTLSPLCLLDYDDAAESTGMGPPLALQITNDIYSFLYRRPFDVHMTAPRVMKLNVTLQQSAWNNLEERAITLGTSFDSYHFPSLLEEVILPDNVFFDPFTDHAHLTSAIHITEQMTIAEAELSMVYSDQHLHMLVLCSPEGWVKVQKDYPSRSNLQEEQWRFWLTGWDSSWSTHRWTYAPDFGVPTASGDQYFWWPTAQVDVIAGPPVPQHNIATVVVALAMLKQEEVLSHAVCLDEHGQVIQVCGASLGLRPHLCCCENMVVGIDRFEGNWRIWNWPVLQHQQFNTSISLESTCRRAYVHAEPASGHFWLIEELQEDVRVTHRDAATLQEIAPETYLSGAFLIEDASEQPLSDYHDVSIIPYQTMLLLFVWRPEEGLVLYQIQ